MGANTVSSEESLWTRTKIAQSGIAIKRNTDAVVEVKKNIRGKPDTESIFD